jgi:hypothetical protein
VDEMLDAAQAAGGKVREFDDGRLAARVGLGGVGPRVLAHIRQTI